MQDQEAVGVSAKPMEARGEDTEEGHPCCLGLPSLSYCALSETCFSWRESMLSEYLGVKREWRLAHASLPP